MDYFILQRDVSKQVVCITIYLSELDENLDFPVKVKFGPSFQPLLPFYLSSAGWYLQSMANI